MPSENFIIIGFGFWGGVAFAVNSQEFYGPLGKGGGTGKPDSTEYNGPATRHQVSLGLKLRPFSAEPKNWQVQNFRVLLLTSGDKYTVQVLTNWILLSNVFPHWILLLVLAHLL